MRAWDDVSNDELNHEGVLKARTEEMHEFHKHGVYTKVDVQECWDETGKGPIGVRWIDVNKGDKDHTKYRSRLVAKNQFV